MGRGLKTKSPSSPEAQRGLTPRGERSPRVARAITGRREHDSRGPSGARHDDRLEGR